MYSYHHDRKFFTRNPTGDVYIDNDQIIARREGQLIYYPSMQFHDLEDCPIVRNPNSRYTLYEADYIEAKLHDAFEQIKPNKTYKFGETGHYLSTINFRSKKYIIFSKKYQPINECTFYYDIGQIDRTVFNTVFNSFCVHLLQYTNFADFKDYLLNNRLCGENLDGIFMIIKYGVEYNNDIEVSYMEYSKRDDIEERFKVRALECAKAWLAMYPPPNPNSTKPAPRLANLDD